MSRLFVGNLPYDVREYEVEDMFLKVRMRLLIMHVYVFMKCALPPYFLFSSFFFPFLLFTTVRPHPRY